MWHAALRCRAWLLWGHNRLCVPSSAAAWLRPPKLRLKELCLLAYEAGRLGNQGSRKAGKSQGRRSSKTKATSNHFLWNRAKSSKAAADHTLAPAGGSWVVGAAGNKGLFSWRVEAPGYSHAINGICRQWCSHDLPPEKKKNHWRLQCHCAVVF